MFKKLKEKITEEVKSSPQRFAEFTQSVSDKLQNNSSADEHFFSIGEDDSTVSTPVNSAEQGFSSVQLVSPSQDTRMRRNSSSSIASDVSFLPRYESGSMYHLQSDLDVSASELEDNASTASSQIGHLTKEQIYSAFQKSQLRYHKYRGRYTDLARHYKELERENAKMKACLDERNLKIHSLQTKIGLLQGADNTDLLVNIDEKENQSENLENLTKYLNDARKEIETLNEKIQEMKANTIVFQSKEQEYKTKITNLEKEIVHYSEREKENNLKLAQNKMELHNEMLGKETDISNLKKDNEVLRQKIEAFEAENKASASVKMENLQSQNKKLIDKVENLTQKCNNLGNELLKVEQYKIEIRELKESEEQLNKQVNKVNEEKSDLIKLVDSLNQGLAVCKNDISELSKENQELKENLTQKKEEFANQISAIREDAKKGLLSLEPKIREKLQNEYSRKEEDIKREFARKIEEMSSKDRNEKDIQMQLFEKNDHLNKLTDELDLVRNELSKRVDEYYNLEKNHLELIEDSTLQEELKHLEDLCEKKEKEIVYLSKENLNLQQRVEKATEKLRILEEKYEAIELDSWEHKNAEAENRGARRGKKLSPGGV
ncbi:hypothetical protein NQ318_005816 [Aromia moschata]|uniref:Golgin subfamily A member 4 n=1 Tax=Aromia moschata TaxID=1265417 RepID=A0AAV8YTL6_9CUCU|nr:hypothetical protein NQ318_005816 [Aromia moschata]